MSLLSRCRSAPTVAALTAVLAFALTGCSSEGTIADTGTDRTTDTQTPSKAPSPAVQAKVLPPRPDIKVPFGDPSELSFEEARDIGLIREDRDK